MNKYQDAFEKASLCCLCTDTVEEANEYLVVLKELVDKATPKKYEQKTEMVDGFKWTDCICPNCKEVIDEFEYYPYCPNCGQAIDWSEEE